MEWLEKIIDARLQKMASEYPLRIPGEIPPEMQDKSVEPQNDWNGWKPVNSPVTDGDIDELENRINHAFPKSFRHYLKYKCFYDLKIEDHAVNLFRLLPDKKLSILETHILKYCYPELIIGRHYIYFADFHDYGLLCFDANQPRPDNEYPVVCIDHENMEVIPFLYAENFRALLEADSDTGNRFILKMNEYYRNQ